MGVVPGAMNAGSLVAAVAHARDYAATLSPNDLIDETSGFTVDNLLALIAAAAPPTDEDEIVDKLGDLA